MGNTNDSKPPPPPPPPSFTQQMSYGVKYIYHKTREASTYVARKTIDTGKQVYGKVSELSVPGQAVQAVKWTNSAVQAGKQAYRSITGTKEPEPSVVRFTGATVGSAVTVNLWFTTLGSRAAREALRAGCIRNSVRMYSWLHLPASLRAAAVAFGVRTNNYIVSGIVPGLFTVWAIYDGYRLVRVVYQMYDEKKKSP